MLECNLTYDEETSRKLRDFPPFAAHTRLTQDKISAYNKQVLDDSGVKFQVQILKYTHIIKINVSEI